MNCVSHVILLFVRQIKMIYSLKLDNQAVDKKNTEEHSPCANVNYINLLNLSLKRHIFSMLFVLVSPLNVVAHL